MKHVTNKFDNQAILFRQSLTKMVTLPAEPSLSLVIGFIALSLIMISGLAWVTKSWRVFGFGIAWAALTAGTAYSGWAQNIEAFPPRAPLILLPTFAVIAYVSFSKLGNKLSQLPIKLLVGFQAFRILVELLIHQAVEQGVAPPQFTWTGMNFDVIAGITALILLFFVDRCPKWLLLTWNLFALLLLSSIVVIAILSVPSPIQQIKPDNVWITFFPFIWLPTILVAIAMTGHLVLFRKLLSRDSTPSGT